MSSTINASTASGGGVVTTADASGILQLQTAGTTALTIDGSQNVGIGTSSPAYKLDVSTASGNAYISVARNALASGQVGLQINGGTSGTIWYLFNATSSNDLSFFGNGAERMRIDSSGNLLVGTTSPTNSSKLSIYAGATTGTTYNVSAATGGSVVTNQQQSTSVSTSAVVILTPNQYASFCVVFGSDGTNRFMDLILCGLGTGTIQVVSSFTVSGSPAARTYTQSSSTYRLAMGSGTYTVKVSTITMDG